MYYLSATVYLYNVMYLASYVSDTVYLYIKLYLAS
jgi:hypothetical protein